MTVKAETRLAKVERHLSPRQLVIMDVIESRRKYRTFIENGQALARSGIPRPTLLDRIAASVAAINRGADRIVLHRLTREAQREGLFLARLSNEVAIQVTEEERELSLMTALLASQLELIVSQRKLPSEDELEVWLTAAVDHRRRLLCINAATERLEDGFFEGTKLLYAKSQECLAENLEQTEKVLTIAVGPRKKKGRRLAEPGMDLKELGPSSEEVDKDAEDLATAWVINVQGAVAAEFGDDAKAVRLLASNLLKDEASNSDRG